MENTLETLNDFKSIKERHMSIDSAKDSGIGENSNLTDVDSSKYDDVTEETNSVTNTCIQLHKNQNDDLDFVLNTSIVGINSNDGTCCENKSVLQICHVDSSNMKVIGPTTQEMSSSTVQNTKSTITNVEVSPNSTETLTNYSENDDRSNIETDMKGFWQPKKKRSITERLPENSYYLIVPSRYIFQGAEVYFDPDEKCDYLDDSSSTDSTESDSEDSPGDVPF